MFDLDLRILRRSQVGAAYLVGILIVLAASLALIALELKALYVDDSQLLGTSLRPLVSRLYYGFPPFYWLWDWLPALSPTLEGIFLSVPFAIIACLLLIGIGVIRYAMIGNEIINGLLKTRRAVRMEGRTPHYDQIQYGDVIVGQQIIEASQELLRWEKFFWLGVVIPVVATIIAALITNVTGLTH